MDADEASLDLDDLVKAWIEREYFSSGGWPPVITDYFVTKWELMSTAFGVPETALEAAETELRCPAATMRLAGLAASVPRFGDTFYVYSVEPEHETVSRPCLPRILELEKELIAAYSAWLKECLLAAYPGLAKKEVGLGDLVERGLPWPPPLPGEYL
jgi:hypothetical protein